MNALTQAPQGALSQSNQPIVQGAISNQDAYARMLEQQRMMQLQQQQQMQMQQAPPQQQQQQGGGMAQTALGIGSKFLGGGEAGAAATTGAGSTAGATTGAASGFTATGGGGVAGGMTSGAASTGGAGMGSGFTTTAGGGSAAGGGAGAAWGWWAALAAAIYANESDANATGWRDDFGLQEYLTAEPLAEDLTERFPQALGSENLSDMVGGGQFGDSFQGSVDNFVGANSGDFDSVVDPFKSQGQGFARNYIVEPVESGLGKVGDWTEQAALKPDEHFKDSTQKMTDWSRDAIEKPLQWIGDLF